MEILIRENNEIASLLAARVVATKVRENPACVLGLATGRTPLRLYAELVRLHREEGLDFSRVITFNLDEYLGLPADSPYSYRRFMHEELFCHLNISPARTHLPDGRADDPRKECARYEAMIRDAGGIDIQVLGLGSNGHIGFNEPTGSLNSRTWIKILSRRTIQDNSALFGSAAEVPRHCITMGIGTIMEARHCLVLAFGARKSHAVHAMVEGPVSAQWPATILQHHRRVTAILDREAAARLNHTEEYAWIEENKLVWQRYQ